MNKPRPLSLFFVVEGDPVPKGRHRTGRNRKTGNVIHYTPKRTEEFERVVALCCKSACNAMRKEWDILFPMIDPVSVEIAVFVPVPESWSMKRTKEAENGKHLPGTRPDLDNYAKSIIDGINGIAFRDDGQIVDLVVRKRYSITPRISVSITRPG